MQCGGCVVEICGLYEVEFVGRGVVVLMDVGRMFVFSQFGGVDVIFVVKYVFYEEFGVFGIGVQQVGVLVGQQLWIVLGGVGVFVGEV